MSTNETNGVDELLFGSPGLGERNERFLAFCDAIAPWYPDVAQMWPRACAFVDGNGTPASEWINLVPGRAVMDPDFGGERELLLMAASIWAHATSGVPFELQCHGVDAHNFRFITMSMHIGRASITRITIRGGDSAAWPSLDDSADDQYTLPCWSDMEALRSVELDLECKSMVWWIHSMSKKSTPNRIHLRCVWRQYGSVYDWWDTPFPRNVESLALIDYDEWFRDDMYDFIRYCCSDITELTIGLRREYDVMRTGTLCDMLDGFPFLQRLRVESSFYSLPYIWENLALWCSNRNRNAYSQSWPWTVVCAGILTQQERRVLQRHSTTCCMPIAAHTPASVLRHIGDFLRVPPVRLEIPDRIKSHESCYALGN